MDILYKLIIVKSNYHINQLLITLTNNILSLYSQK